MINVQVTARGPVASGQASRLLDAGLRRAQEDLARATATAVQAELGSVLKHPTGYYRSHVTAEINATPPRVHDSNVVYGPWLEGVSSANASSRFKGYSTFRRISQRMQSRAAAVADSAVRDAVNRINS